MSLTNSASPQPVQSTIALPGYQITEQLYAGSRTLVYRAVRTADHQPVVIKLLKNEHPSFSELVQFRNQYIITNHLKISGIVQPYSLEPHRNGYALVMEDCGGVSLRHFANGRSLSLETFFAIALQLTDILHPLHQQRIIHKDIKPANILIHPETHQVKLIDFSIASLLPRETQEIQNPNILEGTLAYLSPEQTGRMNRGIDYRNDFYSLGVTFFELLTGQLPFSSDDPMELVHCHLAKQPPNLCDVNPELPLMLGEIIRKLMAKTAENRYQTALGLKHDLMKCQEEWSVTGNHIWFELGQRDVSDRFLIPEKLYGREAEVETLLEAFGRVANGASELMLVAGFSGIGKTAVVNEVHKPIARWNGYFIKGKYDQFNRNIPFSAFVQAFRDLLGQLLSESDRQLQTWKTKILAAVGDSGQVMIEVIPELERIIGKQPAAPELSGSAAQNRFNLLFQKFIQVFATVAHPLVMFLDDLQWADSASLNLMQVLLGHHKTGHLLLIGAYRDNEVFPAHPLLLTVDAIVKAEAIVNTLTLNPLSPSDVNQWVAETLSCSLDRSQLLTELVYQKTKGNPFFATQFLKALHKEGYIAFESETGYWQCDMAQVRSLALTDDVVEFMAIQLQKLPESTQNILKLAACIGNQFDLETLAIVSQRSTAQGALDLWKALQEGLILPISEVYKFYQPSTLEDQTLNQEPFNCTYKFLHDRVQQAAYLLIPDEQKQQTHLRFGRRLLKYTGTAELEEKIFDIVNQLNYGVQLIEQPTEREALARLNLRAGKRAQLATAYASAYAYFDQGIQLLTSNCWQNQYPIALDLYVSAAESACLNTDFETMKQLCDYILTVVTAIEDQVKIYELLIFYYHTQSQFRQAVALALKILNHLGETFPPSPNAQDFLDALHTTTQGVQQVGFENLAQLPPLQDSQKLAALKILRSACFPAYFAAPEILGLLICRLVDVTLNYGQSALTPFAFGIFSVLLNGGVGDVQTGRQFGELAIALEQQQPNLHYRAVTYNAIYGLSRHFYKPVRECQEPLIAGYQSFAQNGDAESCAYCLINAYFCAILSGQNLKDIQTQFEKYIQQVVGFKQEQVIYQLHIWMQVVHNLTESSENSALLKGQYFDIEVKLPQLYQASNFNTINYAHTAQTMLAYLMGEYERSLANAAATEPHLGASTGKFFVSAHNFYYSLCLTALYPHASESVQIQSLEKLQSNQQKMETWANHCPENFLHRYLLVEAEICRIKQDSFAAIAHYDRAILTAKASEYIHEAALANELAAKFYLDWGKERIAQDYITEAYYGYAHWGAKAKVADLETRYPQLLAPILQQAPSALSINETIFASGTTTSTSSSNISDALDLSVILKASQTLSSEIEFNKLLATLLRLVIENAGADKCVLLLQDNSHCRVGDACLFVNGLATIGAEPVVLQRIAVEESQDIPLKLIYRVKNCLEPVVLMNVTAHPEFANDPYFLRQQPKSILCSPILHQGKLLGIVYLENNLISGAFTGDRVHILNLLCAQATISLENARLYQQAQQALQDLQQAQIQIVQSEKMSALGNLVAGVAHEINNPVGFIAGNLQPALDYVKDMFTLVDLYQQECPRPTAALQAKIEAIDLEYMREDLPKLVGSMKLGVDRIRDISTSLRTFSRADKDYKVPFNIHDGINSTILILKHRLKANESRPEIKVVTSYGNIPLIQCFPGQLNQVFMNILANAIDAIEETTHKLSFEQIVANPKQIEVQTSLDELKNQVCIQIRDNGISMSEEVKQQVFNHLFTTKAVGQGTGLGLAIARQIVVEKHSGAIVVNSTLGVGTEFIITLPLNTVELAIQSH